MTPFSACMVCFFLFYIFNNLFHTMHLLLYSAWFPMRVQRKQNHFVCCSCRLQTWYFYLFFRHLTYVVTWSIGFLANRVVFKELYIPNEEPNIGLLQAYLIWKFWPHIVLFQRPVLDIILWLTLSGVVCMHYIWRIAVMFIPLYYVYTRRVAVIGKHLLDISPGILDVLPVILFNGFLYKTLF